MEDGVHRAGVAVLEGQRVRADSEPRDIAWEKRDNGAAVFDGIAVQGNRLAVHENAREPCKRAAGAEAQRTDRACRHTLSVAVEEDVIAQLAQQHGELAYQCIADQFLVLARQAVEDALGGEDAMIDSAVAGRIGAGIGQLWDGLLKLIHVGLVVPGDLHMGHWVFAGDQADLVIIRVSKQAD